MGILDQNLLETLSSAGRVASDQAGDRNTYSSRRSLRLWISFRVQGFVGMLRELELELERERFGWCATTRRDRGPHSRLHSPSPSVRSSNRRERTSRSKQRIQPLHSVLLLLLLLPWLGPWSERRPSRRERWCRDSNQAQSRGRTAYKTSAATIMALRWTGFRSVARALAAAVQRDTGGVTPAAAAASAASAAYCCVRAAPSTVHPVRSPT
mmetsp:Transcript_9944/g.29452  ORF Transcript_9944/g.29452 Transcript_9944/m.29452 type:complete len:211 (+) Transcript_9944:103-735(+)